MAVEGIDELLSYGIDVKVIDNTKAYQTLINDLNGIENEAGKLKALMLQLQNTINAFALNIKKAEASGNTEKIAKYNAQLKTLQNLLLGIKSETSKGKIFTALGAMTGASAPTAIETFTVPPVSDDLTSEYGTKVAEKFNEAGEVISTVYEKIIYSVEEGLKKIRTTVPADASKTTSVETFPLASTFVEDARYNPDSLSAEGELYSTKVNELTGQVIQFTREIKDGIKVTRKYVNGVLTNTSSVPMGAPSAEPPTGFNKILSIFKGEKSEAEKSTKSSGLNKFVSRIKNIVVYRLVRVVMSAIAQSLREGFTSISIGNPIARQVLSEFSAATSMFQASLASTLVPIAQMFSGILLNLSRGFLEVANAISITNAVSQNQAQYFKLNAESIENYAKSLQTANGQLTQLDKFATLTKGTPAFGTMVNITNEDIANLDKATNKYSTLIGVFKTLEGVVIGLGNAIKWWQSLTVESKTQIVNAVLAISAVMLYAFSPIKTLVGLIGGALLSLVAVLSSDVPSGTKVAIGAFAALTVGLAIAYALSEGLQKGIIGAAAAVAGMATIAAAASALGSQVADNGSSVVSTPSIGSYNNISGSGLQQGYATSGLNNEIKGDVYLNGYKVGQVVAEGVYSAGVKSGYWSSK